VHAWATLFQYRIEQAQRGKGDVEFLKRAFGKLLVNFTWWVNRKDRLGKSVFEGGFLGLDNIGVFDRSAELPTGGHLEQADGTAWMAMFCLNMLEIAVEIAVHDPSYDDLAYKFAEHFLWIGAALNKVGHGGMWDEEDGFYYDVLQLPDGRAERLKVRSLVGLLPLCATTVIEPWQRERVPAVARSLEARLRHIPELLDGVHPSGEAHRNAAGRTIAAVVEPDRLRRILSRMLDEAEFLGPHGIRSVSKFHERHPYVVRAGGKDYEVGYRPAESDTAMFGGNSNWRGPVWFPINILLIRALLQFHAYHGDGFRVECPTGSGRLMTLLEVAKEIRIAAAHVSARRRRAAPGVRRHGEVPERSVLARLHSLLRVLPRRQWRRSRRQPPDRVDGPDGDARAGARNGGRRRGAQAGQQDPGRTVRVCPWRVQARPRGAEIGGLMNVEILDDAAAVARRAVERSSPPRRGTRFGSAAARSLRAPSGGRTPWVMLRALSGRDDVPWTHVHVLQVDERIAPGGHADRNLTHMCATLLAPGQSAAPQIHAMPVESEDLDEAAARYVQTLAGLAGSPPVLDLVHLGLGPDGHTASLIPGDPVLDVEDADVALTGMYQGRRRMTLTFPALNRARRVLWLVTGKDKAAMLARLQGGDPTIPAGRVRQDRAVVLADRTAAQAY
jgi:6-phosphogluconolactonase